ncbi:MAG TPA: cupredoxin domain-containing protein [Usitatibacter sp.]|nr:cupredoxin domain-containing protein [Usitatibacter sp.]
MRRARRAFVVGGGMLALAAGAHVVARAAGERVIPVRTYKFAFDPSVIELKKDEPVILELTANDVFMGFSAPDFRVRTDVVPGKTTRLRLVPDKAGTFTFLCDVFCGDGHETMHGTLVVT